MEPPAQLFGNIQDSLKKWIANTAWHITREQWSLYCLEERYCWFRGSGHKSRHQVHLGLVWQTACRTHASCMQHLSRESCYVAGTNMPNAMPYTLPATAEALRRQVAISPGIRGSGKAVAFLPTCILVPCKSESIFHASGCQKTEWRAKLCRFKHFHSREGRWQPNSRLSALNHLLLKSCICTLFGVSCGSRLQLFKIKWCLKLILLTDERILIDE